jgi:sulfopyruvate decarboxylase TPP-binding subunit
MTQVNTITDLGFVGGKHLYHLKVTGLKPDAGVDTVIYMPCDQIQAVVGGALDASGLTGIKITHEGNQVTIAAGGTATGAGATVSLFVLGL